MVTIEKHVMTAAQFKALEVSDLCAKLAEASKAEVADIHDSMVRSGYLPGSAIYLGRTSARGKGRILDGRVRHAKAVELGLVKDALPNVYVVTGTEAELYRVMVQNNAIRRIVAKKLRALAIAQAKADNPDWDIIEMALRDDVSESLVTRAVKVKAAGLDGYVEAEEIPLERAYQLTLPRNKDILEALKDDGDPMDGPAAHVEVKSREDARRADGDAKASGKTFSLTEQQVKDLSKGKMDPEQVHELLAQAQGAVNRAKAAERRAEQATIEWQNAVLFNGLLTRAMRERGLDVEAILAEASDVMASSGESMLAAMITAGMDNIPDAPTPADGEGSEYTEPTGADTYTDEGEYKQAKKRWNDERHAAKPAGYSGLKHSEQKSWRTQYAKANPMPVLVTA